MLNLLRRLGIGVRLQGKYKNLFSTPDGQIVLEDLLRRFYVYSSTHVKDDPTTSAHREGQRQVVLHILKLSKLDSNYLADTARKLMEEERR